VKTSLAPGSPAAARYLHVPGSTPTSLRWASRIVGYGCTTCIGNSGPLPADARPGRPVAVPFGQPQTFPGRIHPDLDLAFIMSPPLVIAFALAGDASRNLRDEPFTTADGRRVTLDEIWPTDAEIDAAMALASDPRDFAAAFKVATDAPAWHALESQSGARFAWDTRSNILRRPPFASIESGSQLEATRRIRCWCSATTSPTDHISPASAIPRDSLVADFLVERGDDRNDLNVFASRRGNWEVMLRAAFHSKTVRNALAPDAPVAHTLHIPTGQVVPIWEAAERYRAAGEAVVIVAGHRYGTGSSRDWAAKGQRLLGRRAVLASSFERIHRSNLIGMGILPLRLPRGRARAISRSPATASRSTPPETSPRARRAVTWSRDARETFAPPRHRDPIRVDLLRGGGVIPHILRTHRKPHEPLKESHEDRSPSRLRPRCSRRRLPAQPAAVKILIPRTRRRLGPDRPHARQGVDRQKLARRSVRQQGRRRRHHRPGAVRELEQGRPERADDGRDRRCLRGRAQRSAVACSKHAAGALVAEYSVIVVPANSPYKT
jgi:aconitate hydratase